MKLSVIIPCYNGAKTIGMQLEALANQTWDEDWEIIVSDNGSTDNSVSVVNAYRTRLSNLRIVDASRKQGQPYALNVGANHALGESIAFCDADDEVGEGWLRAIGDALKKFEFVAARFDFQKLNTVQAVLSRKNPQQNGLQQYTYPNYLPHAGGGSLGLRKQLFEEIGGFDESLLLLHDTDLCWKIQLTGKTLYFVSEAVMHIRLRDDLQSVFKQAKSYGEYNVLIYKRYRPLGMPKLSLKKGIKTWIQLLRRFREISEIHENPRLAWSWGWCLGRLKGSIQHRVLAL